MPCPAEQKHQSHFFFLTKNLFCWDLLNLLSGLEVREISLKFSPERTTPNYDQHSLYLPVIRRFSAIMSIKGHWPSVKSMPEAS